MKSILLFAILAAPVLAEPLVEVDETIWGLRAELLVVRLPDDRALAVRESAKMGGKEIQQKLLEFVKAKQAELVDWPVVTTVSGDRAFIENIQEIRYPIEFAPPQALQNSVPPEVAAVPTPSAPPPVAEDAAGKKAGTEKQLAGMPATFETRNTGLTLEFEAVVEPDGKMMNVQLAPQRVTFVRNRRATIEAPGHYKLIVEQPEFHTQKTASQLRLRSGEPHLLTFFKLPEPAGVTEISVLTITAENLGTRKVLVRAPEQKPEAPAPDTSEPAKNR